jgi:hypothetical protein
MNTLETLRGRINSFSCRSAWSRGVRDYALLILENLESLDPDDFFSWSIVERALLNGAGDWREYSEGGCALIYDSDIAAALCSPSELRRTDNGRRMPSRSENWIDVQTRALHQAAAMVRRALLSD